MTLMVRGGFPRSAGRSRGALEQPDATCDSMWQTCDARSATSDLVFIAKHTRYPVRVDGK